MEELCSAVYDGDIILIKYSSDDTLVVDRTIIQFFDFLNERQCSMRLKGHASD